MGMICVNESSSIISLKDSNKTEKQHKAIQKAWQQRVAPITHANISLPRMRVIDFQQNYFNRELQSQHQNPKVFT